MFLHAEDEGVSTSSIAGMFCLRYAASNLAVTFPRNPKKKVNQAYSHAVEGLAF